MNILYIQPILASYRVALVEALTNNSLNKVWVLADSVSTGTGFMAGNPLGVLRVETCTHDFIGKRFFYQSSILSKIFEIRPDAVISFANPRYISFWASLILCWLMGIRFYSHGQGLFAYPNSGILRKLLYRALINFSTKYLCYTDSGKISLLAIGANSKKIAVVENSIELTSTVVASKKSYAEPGIIFIGRLRDGCRLELLIDAARQLRVKGENLVLHVVGDGEMTDLYKTKFLTDDWIIWHGSIHSHEKIAEISMNCRLGCYPGDAGLSVVHMFGLSLPPLVHGTMPEHMGPEPSYVVDGFNGFLFQKNESDSLSLSNLLAHVWNLDSADLRLAGEYAFQSYQTLNNPSLGKRFLNILEMDSTKYDEGSM
jgi:glycosyltransferase involved in cell wall biosynthesis